ncbi:hypothetical protein ACOME3_002158 [Neoechinorhynchus agilis]
MERRIDEIKKMLQSLIAADQSNIAQVKNLVEYCAEIERKLALARKRIESLSSLKEQDDNEKEQYKLRITVMMKEIERLTAQNELARRDLRDDISDESEEHVDLSEPTAPPYTEASDEDESCISLDFNDLLPRTHVTETRTMFRSEFCDGCGRKISFNCLRLRCQICCRVCHIECGQTLSGKLRCVLAMRHPTKRRLSLSDYCPASPPFIPPIIFYCVREIDFRRLNQDASKVYSKKANESRVRLLRHAFLKPHRAGLLSSHTRDLPPGVSDLRLTDLVTIAATIKQFLSSLVEPIITHDAVHKFAKAVVSSEYAVQTLTEALLSIPQENQQTLAFILLHLQKLSHTTTVQMGTHELANEFGPLIVGTSVSALRTRIATEANTQISIIKSLLDHIPSDFYRSLLVDKRIASVLRKRQGECSNNFWKKRKPCN